MPTDPQAGIGPSPGFASPVKIGDFEKSRRAACLTVDVGVTYAEHAPMAPRYQGNIHRRHRVDHQPDLGGDRVGALAGKTYGDSSITNRARRQLHRPIPAPRIGRGEAVVGAINPRWGGR